MTDREKLIDLMIQAKKADTEDVPFSEFLADFLLASGVMLPPEQWISADDRAPEIGVPVLVIVSGKPRSNITLKDAYELAEYDPEGWILEMWPEWMDAEVSYWMPLPDQPKGE